MWLGKFLDLEEDIEELKSTIQEEVIKDIKKSKLTPLEFTIIEIIYNYRTLSGYDLIQSLNKHFAGTWEAKSGTIYPILSKLKRNGFLDLRTVKTPIGPLRKVYSLTEAGEELLKLKVNKNFSDQLKFTENFLVELAAIYIKSFPKSEQKEQIDAMQETIKQTLQNVIENIPTTLQYRIRCGKCGSEIGRNVNYCPYCGDYLSMPLIKDEDLTKEPLQE